MNPVLKINDLSVGYGNILFEKLNLEIHESEFVTIMGENGAGKSSLLKSILGIQEPLSGTIKFWGEELSKSHSEIFNKTAVVLSGRESVLNPLVVSKYLTELSKFYSNWDFELQERLFEGFDLESNKKFYQLSLGEFSKVKLIRALCIRPKLLILDELTANLSSTSRTIVLSHLMEQFSSQKMAVIYVSHFKEEAIRISDKIFQLNINGLVENE